MWEMSLMGLVAWVAGAQSPALQTVPPVRIVDTAVRYPVAAQSIGGINAELRAYATAMERSEQGHTRSEIEVSSQLDPTPGVCRIATAEVSLDVTTTLPQWQAEPAAKSEVRAQWERSLALLQRHEAGHRDNAVDAAESLRQAVLALPPQKNCLKLQMAISLQLQRMRWQLELRDESYDLRTRNGLRDDPRRMGKTLDIARQDGTAQRREWPARHSNANEMMPYTGH